MMFWSVHKTFIIMVVKDICWTSVIIYPVTHCYVPEDLKHIPPSQLKCGRTVPHNCLCTYRYSPVSWQCWKTKDLCHMSNPDLRDRNSALVAVKHVSCRGLKGVRCAGSWFWSGCCCKPVTWNIPTQIVKKKVKFRIGELQHRSPRLIVLSPQRSSFIHL
jgi:hypothetical protein